MVFRKRPADPALEEARRAFAPVAVALDRAQRALLEAIPTSRDPGAPLAEALDRFEAGLEAVAAVMPAWRLPLTEERWRRCDEALRAARAEAHALRADPPGPTQFELLNMRVGDVLAPLEEFADTERALAGRRV